MSTAASLRAVQQKRSLVFQQRFKLPASEELIADFVCALQQRILLQGRLYVSQHYVCFYAKVFGSETVLVIPAADITGVTLAKSLGIVPNAIKLYTTYNQYWLGSFVSRQQAYNLLTKVSKGEQLGSGDVVMEDSRRSNASAAATDDGPELSERRQDDEQQQQDDEEEQRPKKRRPAKPAAAKGKAGKRREQEEQQEQEEDYEHAARPAADDDDDERPAAAARGKKRMNGRTAAPKANGRSPVKKKTSRPPSDDERHSDGDRGTADDERPPQPSKRAPAAAKRGGDDSDDGFNEDDEIFQRLKAAKAANAARGKDAPAAAAAAAASASSTSPPSTSSAIVISPPVMSSSPPPPSGPKQRRAGDFSEIYTYPPLLTPIEAKVETLHKQIRKQHSGVVIGAAGRRFIYDGYLERQGRWSVVEREGFLFSDALVLCKRPAENRWEMKQFMPLCGLTVDYRPREWQPSMRKTKLPHPFRLIYTPPSAAASASASASASTTPAAVATSTTFSPPPPSGVTPPLPIPSTAAEYTVSTPDLDAQAQWTQRLLLAIAAYHYNSEPGLFRPVGWYYHYVLGGIHSAVWDGDEKLVQALVKADEAAIDGDDMEGRGVLHVCAEKNDASMIPLLLSLGASSKKLDSESLTAVHVAARNGCLTTLNALLDDRSLDFAALHHGDRSLKQYRLTSALWLCVLNGQMQWQDCLLVLLSLSRAAQRRMIMDDRDDDGQTLLEAACSAGLTHAIPVLLKHGASIDLPNRQGLTPLSLAAKRGQQETVRALIANGAQPNLRFPPSLSTPLHHAASAVAFLLASVGSRPALKNSRGVKGVDLFPSADLEAAEALHAARPPVDTDDPMHPQAASHAQNGGHALERCFLCQEDWSLVRKRDYCRRCGLNVCQQDSSKKLIFRRVRAGKKERVLARVCDGCYNIAAFRQREDGGVGLQPNGKLRIKKKRSDDGRETSRKAAPSQSRKWEDVESEEEQDGEQDGDGDVKSAAAGHSRHASQDESYDSPVEDASGLADSMRAGIKRGFKVGLKVGGFLGGQTRRRL